MTPILISIFTSQTFRRTSHCFDGITTIFVFFFIEKLLPEKLSKFEVEEQFQDCKIHTARISFLSVVFEKTRNEILDITEALQITKYNVVKLFLTFNPILKQSILLQSKSLKSSLMRLFSQIQIQEIIRFQCFLLRC